jgi:LEM3 (ligand-effect modulator 3) family / CDC50 family
MTPVEFNVTTFGGTKSILISTRTVMGGKNPFLGIAYIVVGGLCILLGAIFTATHIIKPR